MPRRTIALQAGEYYHLYNRGVNRQKIFFNQENYLFFLRRVRKYLLEEGKTSEVSETSEVLPGCEVIAYCLMPNHYHFLIRPLHNELSHKMQLLGISYTKAINKQQRRVGPLFQGQFQAVHVDCDEYLLHLSRYLHLNPVLAGLVKKPEDWPFSSYNDYLGLRQGTLPKPDVILSQFENRAAYERFVKAYLPRDRDKIAHLLFDED
jgi:putative transposase